MKKLSFSLFTSFLLAVSLHAQYFSAVYPGAGNGLSGNVIGGGYVVATTKGVLKINPQGQAAWNRQLTGIFLLEATQLNNGQAALTGFKGDDVYFNTIDTNGNVSNCTGNTFNVTAASLAFQTPQPSGQLTYNLATGQASRWSVVTNFSSPATTPNLCVAVGTATVSALSEVSLSVYPNPSPILSLWAIECPEAMTVQARLTDAYGRVVVQEQIQLSTGLNEWRPGLSGLPKGVYIASLSDGQGVISRKFVIE